MLFVILFAICYLPVVLLYPTKVINKKRWQKNKKMIVTSNHYSNVDPLLYNFKFFTKFRFMAKKELFENKFSAFIFKRIGTIPVDRKQISPSTYKHTLKELNDNKQVFIFPEGTRNKSGSEEMANAKAGVITFASKGDAEILPMLIYRKPRIFRKNYIIVGDSFKVDGENPKRLTQEEIEKNLAKYAEVMVELRKELDDYLTRKKKRNIISEEQV